MCCSIYVRVAALWTAQNALADRSLPNPGLNNTPGMGELAHNGTDICRKPKHQRAAKLVQNVKYNSIKNGSFTKNDINHIT